MDRRSRKKAAARPPGRGKRRAKNNGHVGQIVALVSVMALFLGSIVAWKVYSNNGGWREWTMSTRSGLFGTHGSHSSEEAGDGELEGKSIRYHGGGYADMGEFSVGRYDSITNTTLTVNFLLKGMTPCDTETSFNEFMRENERAFRDRVTEAVHDCRERDYTDSKSMSKKVVARVNRAFNGRFLESAELVDFEVFESIGTYQSQVWESGEQAVARSE